MKTKILFLGILCSLFFACDNEKEVEEIIELKKANLIFEKLTLDGTTITAEKLLKQIKGKEKAGFQISKLTSSDTSIAEIQGEKPNFSIKIKKAGTFKITLVLEKKDFENVKIEGEITIIKKIATFSKLTITNGAKIISTNQILAQIQGLTALNYTLKNIEIPADKSSFAVVQGAKPNFSILIKKHGAFTAKITLEKNAALDVEIQNCQFESKNPAATFSKLTITNGAKTISTNQILAQIQGLTALNYTLKNIEIPADKSSFAVVQGDKPNFSILIKKHGAFTAKITLEKNAALDVEIQNCQFESKNPATTFSKLTITNGAKIISTNQILAQIQGLTALNYTLKNIEIPADKSSFAVVQGDKPNFSILIKKHGAFTAKITLEKNAALDVEIQNCQFESKNMATFDKFTRNFSGSKTITENQILAQIRGLTGIGYTLRSVIIPVEKRTIADLAPTLDISINILKPGNFTATIVLEKTGHFNVIIENCAFEIEKIPAPILTFQKFTRNYKENKTITTEQILAKIEGTKTNYTLKSIVLSNATGNVLGIKANLQINILKAGNFTATIVLERENYEDAKIENCLFEIEKIPAPILTFQKIFKSFDIGKNNKIKNNKIIEHIKGLSGLAYRLKSIEIPADKSNLARVTGTKPNFEIEILKASVFTATIILELENYEDAEIKNCSFEFEKYEALVYGHSNGYDIARQIIQTQDGNYAIVGETHKAGNKDIAVWLMDDNLTITSDKVYGAAHKDSGYGIIETDDGNLAITGSSERFEGVGNNWVDEYYTAKIRKSDGSAIWEKVFGGWSGDKSLAITKLQGGDYVVGGYTNSSLLRDKPGNTDNNLWDLVFCKYADSDGQVAWWKMHVYLNFEVTMSLATLADGNIVGVGLTGSNRHRSKYDIYIQKISTDDSNYGQFIWSTAIDYNNQDDRARSVTQASNGDLVVVGRYNNNVRILKLNQADGSIIFSKTYGGSGLDRLTSVVETNDGNFVAAGYTTSKGEGGEDVWVFKIDKTTGDVLWEKTFGTPKNDGANSIIQDSNGSLVLAGWTSKNNDVETYIIRINDK